MRSTYNTHLLNKMGVSSDEISADASNFDIMNFFMQKMPWIIFIVFIIIVIVLFAKPGSATSEGGI